MLEKRFREELKRTPGEELRRARFEHVRRSLLDTDESIAMIASETGFASGASLSRMHQPYFLETFVIREGSKVTQTDNQWRAAPAMPALLVFVL